MSDAAQTIRLEIQRIRPTAVLPDYAHEGDAGMDIVAAEAVTLAPGEVQAVPTGLILRIPRGYEVQIRPRSGLSLKTRLRLPNSPGTIDSGYRDELRILVENSSQIQAASEASYDLHVTGAPHGTYEIRPGDRIAQMILAKVSQAEVVAVQEFSEHDTEDRGGGFGSSGVSTRRHTDAGPGH